MNLQEEAILLHLGISMQGVSARSRTASAEIAEAHDADRNSVRGIIFKLSSEDLKKLQAIANEARGFFLENTLPWDKNGYRLCPVTRYTYIKRELERMRNDFEDAVADLIKRYPAIRKDYLRRVNDLAQEVPFPTLEQMKQNFNFELNEQPIAKTSDFRLKHVDPKTVEEIKAKINTSMAERLDEAHKDIINRLFSVVARVHDATGKENGRLFETLVTNIEEAVDVLPKLNLQNDPEITRLITRVRTELSSIDVQTLRSDPKERAKTSKLAGSILQDLRGFHKKSVVAKPKPQPMVEKAVAAQGGKIKSRFASARV